jgi:tetratricopeptide (TPR) repeat protein
MSEQKVAETVVATETNQLERAQGFWKKNGKIVSFVLGFIIAVTASYFAYNNFIIAPKAEKAAEAMYKAEQLFATDSTKKALEGDGATRGFLYIIKNYSGTKQANLAHYYAGICYLKQGDFNKAIEHLKDFSTDAKQVQLMAYGALGDAYAEAGKKEEAISSYKKAATTFVEDDNNCAEYLFRAALLSETLGKNAEALAMYKELKTKFAKTEKGYQAEKYIGRLTTDKADLGVN